MYEMHNAERAKAGVAPLALDAGVQSVAKQRARDMAATGEFTHNPTKTKRYIDLLKEAGVSYRRAGENIAYNSYSASRTVDIAMDGFMTSKEGHREAILNPQYTHVGIGIVESTTCPRPGVASCTYFAVVFIAR